MKKLIAVLLIFLMLSTTTCALDVEEKWPAVKDSSENKSIVETYLEKYKENKNDYRIGFQDYDTFGDYLNYGTFEGFNNSRIYKFDENGIPKTKYGEDFKYNPSVVAQFALHEYGKYHSGDESARTRFISMVDWLAEAQDEKGAFRCDYTYKHYLNAEAYKPGWTSALVQGQALSVFARAYHISKDKKYLDAGNKTLDYLTTPIEKGGVMTTLEDLDPSLKEYIFFEEYITSPDNYTLNGYMFSLIGLYDWKVITEKYQKGENKASQYYEAGMKTLVNILPYYDMGGFSSYDMSHVTYNKAPNPSPSYHAIHIYQLHALNSIYNDKWLKHIENTWIRYVE